MAKRIEFLAPVEAMRGNLSGNQVLEYPEQNNAAFDAPNGKRSYARNYQTRYIGAKRASNGKKYFAVKTKSATYLSTSTKLAMALLGGTGAMRAGIVKKTALYNYTVIPAYESQRRYGYIASNVSIAKFIFDLVYAALKAKASTIQFRTYSSDGTYAVTYVRNPWVFTSATGAQGVEIAPAILVKFWNQLATNPIMFTVDGMKGVAHDGDTFADVIGRGYNVLSLTSVTESGTNYVKMSDLYVVSETTEGDIVAIVASNEVAEGALFLSDTLPE